MIRYCFALVAVASISLPMLTYGQIYKVTDDDKGVVFTDRPETVTNTPENQVEKIDLPEMNTAEPINVRPVAPITSSAEPEEAPQPTVRITSPANESTIAMGPGNFSVSASAEPPLNGNERLILMMDGQAIGAAQSSSSWFIEGALRGPHDLVVQRTSARGTTIAISETVRVYVLRPSLIGR